MSLAILTAQASAEIGKTYRIRSKKFPTKSLLVNNSSSESDADVVLWTETDVPSQQWTLHAITDSTMGFACVYSGYYACPRTQRAGGTLRMNRALRNAQVILTEVDATSNIYHITSLKGDLYLAVSSGTNGEMPAWQESDATDESMQWVLEEVEPKSVFSAAMRDEMIDAYIKRFTTSKGSSMRTFCNGGWGEAEQMEVALDAYETTGNETYLNLAKFVYNYFNQQVGSDWDRLVYTDNYHWFGHDFNDDVMWQIIAVARLGWLTGSKTYTNAAKKNFDKIYDRAFIEGLGLMRWAEQSGDQYGANSCVNGPTEVAACYLGMSGAGEEYFEKARDLYAAQRYRLANMNTGQVYDSFVWNPATNGVARDNNGNERRNNWTSTYNQGMMLGAACLLYEHYGDELYLKDAKKIMSFTKSSLCNSYGQIKVCQDENNGDLCGFKGILMRYVRRFVLALNQPSYHSWLLSNAMLAYSNRSEDGLTGTGWLTKATQESTKNGFGCSTSVSAAVNAPLWDIVKNGFDTLQVEHFDYHRGLLATSEAGRGRDGVVQVSNGYWAQFDNVDFGDQTAHSIILDVTAPAHGISGSVEIYFDKMEGAPAGVCELKDLNTPQGWYTLMADIKPTTGLHHVYLHFTCSSSRAKAYKADQFIFSTKTVDELTDVEDLPEMNVDTAVGTVQYFDLLGRRLTEHPTSGTFILRKGKKARIIVK